MKTLAVEKKNFPFWKCIHCGEKLQAKHDLWCEACQKRVDNLKPKEVSVKHSKYPWKVMVTTDCKYDLKGPERFIVIDEEHFANVRLLSQAPDMLDVIKHTRSILVTWRPDLAGTSADKLTLLNTLINVLGSSIEKATGQDIQSENECQSLAKGWGGEE